MNIHHMVTIDIILGFKTGCADNHCSNHHTLISTTTFFFSQFFSTILYFHVFYVRNMWSGGIFGKIRREVFQLGKVLIWSD